MKIVLVTGGCGCLGSWIIKLLIENKDKVICLDTSKNLNRLKLILDENSLKAFSTEAHKLGLLPKQAQGIIQYYNDLAGSSETEANNKAEAGREEAEKNLRKEFGSTYDNRINAAKKLATSTLGNEFLNNTLLQDGSKLGDNPTVVKMFADLAAQISEDSIVKGDAPAYMSNKEIGRQIAVLQQPGSAYWDKKNPSHLDAVAEVQSLIQKKNNEEEEVVE